MSSRIGNVLVKTNVLNPEQLEQALEAQKSSGNSLFDTVIQLGFASEQDYLQSLSKHFSTPIIELDSVTLEASAIALIPADLAKKHCLVPIVQENSTLQVAMSDPSNLVALNEIKFFTGLDIKVSIASESKIRSQYQKYYEQVGKQENDELLDSPDESLMELFKPQEPKSAETPTTSELTQHNEPTDDAPLIQLVNAILVKALKQNASAIYFEPFEKSFRVRFRIDSNLQEIMSTPANLEFPVTSRIKFMANLDIEERDLPQNGRLTLKMARGSERLVRVSTAPTLFGEKLVLRILEKANRPLKLAKLGLNEHQSEQLTQSLSKSEGMILVAGPANSGKSTTLYAAISALNQAQKDIATIEDVVEFPIEG
ncbi:MAG: Flp pilus assembly complex ATPase component TadA, partial [Bdellovibrionales bacterium]|nr:Flp pilus assembly complex ATPase component TadA [Bdellovibrionales bacterium]